MDAKTLEDMISDPTVSDDAVFDATVEYTTDKEDADGNCIPTTDEDEKNSDKLRELITRKRPAVEKRLEKYVRDLFCPNGLIP